MARSIRTLFQSLGTRVLVPLFFTIAAVLAADVVVGSSSIHDHVLNRLGGEIRRSSKLIRQATHDGMLPFSPNKDDTRGIGLGLSAVDGIVHRHDGAIDVDSTPGRGTTFHLRLPRLPKERRTP